MRCTFCDMWSAPTSSRASSVCGLAVRFSPVLLRLSPCPTGAPLGVVCRGAAGCFAVALVRRALALRAAQSVSRGGPDSERRTASTVPASDSGLRLRRVRQLYKRRFGSLFVHRRRCRAQLAPPQVECAERQSVCRAESSSGLTGSLEPIEQFLPLRGGAPRPMLRTACPRHDFTRLRLLGSGE